MKVDFRLVTITIALVTCAGVCLYWQLSGDSEGNRGSLVYSGVKRGADVGSGVDKRNVRRVREVSSRRVNQQRERPDLLNFDDEELRELTDLARKLLASLQAALDADDFGQIQSIIAMIQKTPKGVLSKTSAGIPVHMRKKLIEALGWFGSKGIPEMVDFLDDADPEVVEAAVDQFELALQDVSLGDRDRAEIVVMASKAIHDSEALERMFMEIPNMRNSVAAQTLVDICQLGTEESKALMPETIEFVTGTDEGEITTVEDIERWLAENPDGPDDDDLFGPMAID